MNGHACSITNGEEHGFTESGLGYAEGKEDERFLVNAAQEGAKVQVNKYGGAVSSVLERRPPNFDLFNESLFGVRIIASDRDHAGLSILKKNLTGHRNEDVKKVLKKQDIHDLYCPTCNFYFTKRVILPRKAISPDYEDVISLPTGEVSVPMPEVTGPLSDIREPLLGHEREVSRVDAIKAIVYGGLLESIASLSILVSAAGGDATTLNIVALGLANVFGGLLVLGNNLMTLKELTAQQYEVQLGQPKHFLIHATIAVISYFFFGLISPLVYGFSFYKSDNKYLKLATLAASSLVCITILSTGKAYVQRPPKAYFWTIFYYISLAVTVSGLSYIAGHLISILLMKLRAFE